MTCLDDVQLAVRRVANGTSLGMADVLQALIITAYQPKRDSRRHGTTHVDP